MKIIALILSILICVVSVFSQSPNKVLVADGTKSPFGVGYVLEEEGKDVLNAVEVSRIVPSKISSIPCTANEDFRIKHSTEGFFTINKVKSWAYLYWACDKKSNHLFSGIIVKNKRKILAHYAFANRLEEKIENIGDLNGDSLDELAIYNFSSLNDINYAVNVRFVEILPNEIKKFGETDLLNSVPVNPANTEFNFTATKVYAEKQANNVPSFSIEKLKLDNAPLKNIYDEKTLSAANKSWQIVQPVQPIKLNDDVSDYQKNVWKFGLADLASGFLGLEAILFILLMPVTFYGYYFAKWGFKPAKNEPSKKLKAKQSVETKTEELEPELPALDPLNCPSCGAGVPLRTKEMSCPNCNTSFPVPKEYEELISFRSQAVLLLKRAENYWSWVDFLTSNWIISLFLSLVFLTIISLVSVFFFSYNSFVYYRIFYLPNAFGVGVLAALYWIFIFGIFGLGIVKTKSGLLPTLEDAEKIGVSENAKCSNCSGAIEFGKSDFAAICGYCGVETYRAKMAWQVRNITNEVRQKANFSLTRAMKEYQTRVQEFFNLPLALMCVILIPATLCIIFSILGNIQSAFFDTW